MQLEIPDGAHVHILIGKAPPLALTDQTGSPRPMTATRSLIRGALVAALLCGAFLVGKQFGTVRTVVAAEASTSQSFAPPDSRSAGPGAAPAAVPPEFTQQLQQPATVLPPPGRTPPGKSPFGLEP